MVGFLPATIFAIRICNPIFISQIEFATHGGHLDSNSGKETALRKYFVAVCALLVLSAAGMAQLPTSGNVYFGYSYFHGNTGVSNTGSLNGWEATLEGRTFPHVGVVADVGGEYGKLGYPVLGENVTTHIVSILFGPRFSVPVGKFRPFAQFLLGAAHLSESASDFSNGETCYTDAIGAGVDYNLVPRVNWRVQVESFHTRFHGTGEDNARISTGLAVKF